MIFNEHMFVKSYRVEGEGMIIYVVSDLLLSPAQVLVNTVNTVGVMGKGIAKDFKNIYPEMFTQYQVICERKQFDVGKLWLYKTPHKWILNFPTKKHWRQPAKPEYIEAGLKKFVNTYADKGITSISFPMLGCGNGELDWDSQVRPLMEYYLRNLPIDVFIHLYKKDPFLPEHRNIKEIKTWLRSQPESLAFSEVWEDLQDLLANSQRYTRLDNNRMFKAKLLDDGEGIIIQTNDETEETIVIRVEELMDLWQHLRAFGFCMDRTIPGGLDIHAPYIVAILSHLPYLKPVLIDRYDNKGSFQVGLQLMPIPELAKGELKLARRAERFWT